MYGFFFSFNIPRHLFSPDRWKWSWRVFSNRDLYTVGQVLRDLAPTGLREQARQWCHFNSREIIRPQDVPYRTLLGHTNAGTVTEMQNNSCLRYGMMCRRIQSDRPDSFVLALNVTRQKKTELCLLDSRCVDKPQQNCVNGGRQCAL